jgi:hypothetical protein
MNLALKALAQEFYGFNMINYDKNEIKEQIHIEDVYELLSEWGAEPEYTSFGLLCSTICHNLPGEGSRKLYFYENSNLFRCYTGCDASFDIFELAIKVMDNQNKLSWDLNEAVRFIANKFHISGTYETDEINKLEDWKYIANYNRIANISISENSVQLKPYENNIIDRLNYNVKLTPWLDEKISQEVLTYAQIGFYPGGD